MIGSRTARAAAIALAILFGAGPSCRAPASGVARNTDLSVRYVGRDACLPCHEEIGRSSAGTGMGRAFYPPSPADQPEDFGSGNRLELPREGLRYVMVHDESGYHMRQVVLGEDGSEIATASLPITWVVGSGNHSRSYLTERSGALWQMPVCWYPGKPGWDLCPGYELKNRYFTREADLSCLFCHNGRMTTAEEETNRYTGTIPHGIDCERCHGPGELHVARWKSRAGDAPDRDDTIVNPAELPKGTRMQVCFQCHLGDADASERSGRPSKSLLDLRPGMALSGFVDVFTYEPPSENRFALGGQGDRLLLSRCYEASGGGLDCLTCHDPHVTIYAKDRPPDHFRRACLGCHTPSSCAMGETERRSRVASDDCTACHMRRAEPADQRFTTFTDHWIRRRIDPPSPPPEGRPSHELAPIFPRDHAALPEWERSLNLARAYLARKTGSVDGAVIPWSRAEDLLRSSVAARPETAESWFLLGKIALWKGDAAEALGDFRETLKREPRHRDARRNLAATLLQMGRGAEAEPLLRETLRARPDDVVALSDLGRALVETQREEEAAAAFDRAAALDPAEPVVLANRGLLAARRGRHEQAAEDLRRAAALDPSQPAIWRALAASLRALGREPEARAAEQRASRRSGSSAVAPHGAHE